MRKIVKIIKSIFVFIYNIIDKCLVTPISKFIYRLMSMGKDKNGNLEKILNRPIILLYISLLCAILIIIMQ